METWHIADSLDEIWKIVDRANKYIDETTPWVLAKSEETKPRLNTVLYKCCIYLDLFINTNIIEIDYEKEITHGTRI